MATLETATIVASVDVSQLTTLYLLTHAFSIFYYLFLNSVENFAVIQIVCI